MSNIKIHYKDYIPSNFVDEFKKSITVNSELIKEDSNVSFFTGDPIGDILIILPGSLITSAIYDLLKTGVLKLIGHIQQLERTKKEYEIKIQVEISHEEEIIFEVTGTNTETNADEKVEKLIEKMKAPETKEFLKEEKFVSKSHTTKTVTLTFNTSTNNWEPTDFKALRDEIERMSNMFRS